MANMRIKTLCNILHEFISALNNPEIPTFLFAGGTLFDKFLKRILKKQIREKILAVILQSLLYSVWHWLLIVSIIHMLDIILQPTTGQFWQFTKFRYFDMQTARQG